ncbi:hypothetical protein PAPYR_5398 [Paratrimastix pyriformis]|uniref:Uncharacterized protein n=1 Tax=Paratrimastix pyriformis TaxID=342808 RepID=A0ABQ8ULN3_9EUKA|nr:hypothetical protein PAPYR_5398 [Paratrimastix pyriformis]
MLAQGLPPAPAAAPTLSQPPAPGGLDDPSASFLPPSEADSRPPLLGATPEVVSVDLASMATPTAQAEAPSLAFLPGPAPSAGAHPLPPAPAAPAAVPMDGASSSIPIMAVPLEVPGAGAGTGTGTASFSLDGLMGLGPLPPDWEPMAPMAPDWDPMAPPAAPSPPQTPLGPPRRRLPRHMQPPSPVAIPPKAPPVAGGRADPSLMGLTLGHHPHPHRAPVPGAQPPARHRGPRFPGDVSAVSPKAAVPRPIARSDSPPPAVVDLLFPIPPRPSSFPAASPMVAPPLPPRPTAALPRSIDLTAGPPPPMREAKPPRPEEDDDDLVITGATPPTRTPPPTRPLPVPVPVLPTVPGQAAPPGALPLTQLLQLQLLAAGALAIGRQRELEAAQQRLTAQQQEQQERQREQQQREDAERRQREWAEAMRRRDQERWAEYR